MDHTLLQRHESEHILENTIQQWTQLSGKSIDRQQYQYILASDILYMILFLSITNNFISTELTLYSFILTSVMYYQLYIAHLLHCSRFIEPNIIYKLYYMVFSMLILQCTVHLSYNVYSTYSICAAAALRILLAAMYCYTIYTHYSIRYISLYYIILNLFYSVLLFSSIGLHSTDRNLMFLAIGIIDICQTILFGVFVSPTAIIDINQSHITTRLSTLLLCIVPLTGISMLVTVLPPYIDSLKPYDLLPNIEPITVALSINRLSTGFTQSINSFNESTIHLSTLYGYITIALVMLYGITVIYNDVDTYKINEHALYNGTTKSLTFIYIHSLLIAGFSLICVSTYYTTHCILANIINVFDLQNGNTVYQLFTGINSIDPTNNDSNQTDWNELIDSCNISMSYGISFVMLILLIYTHIHQRKDYEMLRCIDCSLSTYLYVPVHTILSILYYTIQLYIICTFITSIIMYYIFYALATTQYNAAYYQLWSYTTIIAVLAVLTSIQHTVIDSLLVKHHTYHEFSLDEMHVNPITHGLNSTHTRSHHDSAHSQSNIYHTPKRSIHHDSIGNNASASTINESDLYLQLQHALLSSNKNKSLSQHKLRSTNGSPEIRGMSYGSTSNK